MEQSKVCTGCLKDKPLEDFALAARGKYGRLNRCRECTALYRRTNRKALNAAALRWVKANPERNAAIKARWLENNPGRISELNKSYRENKREYYAELQRAHRLASPEKYRGYSVARRLRKRGNGVFTITPKDYRRLYAGPCFYCGSSENITADHVIPVKRGGRDSIGNLVSACQSCNSKKHTMFIMEWKLRLTR